jgi:hypothetical protein
VQNNLARIREELQSATGGTDRDIEEQIESVGEELMELTGGDRTRDTPAHLDRIAEPEKTLGGLREEADGETAEHIANAEALLGECRERHSGDE